MRPLSFEYTLVIPAHIERRLTRLGAVAQRAIHAALRQTVRDAAGSRFGTLADRQLPPLRLYADRYRVFYRLEGDTHHLVVLSFGRAPGASR